MAEDLTEDWVGDPGLPSSNRTATHGDRLFSRRSLPTFWRCRPRPHRGRHFFCPSHDCASTPAPYSVAAAGEFPSQSARGGVGAWCSSISHRAMTATTYCCSSSVSARPFFDPVPFLEAAAAAGGGGVLGDEDGVVAERGLLAVVGNLRWSEALCDEIDRVAQHHVHPLVVQVLQLAPAQVKPAPERGAGEGGEELIRISHDVCPASSGGGTSAGAASTASAGSGITSDCGSKRIHCR